MIEKVLNGNVLLYILIGVFSFGMLLKLILFVGYSRMIRASNNMGRTNNKFINKLKLKFETLYKLRIKVNNVDAFVDKSINNHKIGGILLITWEKLSGQVAIICVFIGLTCILYGVYLEVNRMWIVSVLSMSILTGGLLIVLENLLNKHYKKEIIKGNIVDYLENFLINRLENEDIQIDLESIGTSDYKPSLKERWLKFRENRNRKKEVKKATKLFKKHTKKAARAKRKEKKKKRKLEAKRAVKQEKTLKKENRRRESEIRKALKLEKKARKRNNRRNKTNYKNKVTPAQKNKELLKKEIEMLRQLEEKQNNEIAKNDQIINIEEKQRINNNNSNEYNKKVLEIGKTESNGNKNDYNSEIDREAAASLESHSIIDDKKVEPSYINSQTNTSKKKSKEKNHISQNDQQVIEDILREYLG